MVYAIIQDSVPKKVSVVAIFSEILGMSRADPLLNRKYSFVYCAERSGTPTANRAAQRSANGIEPGRSSKIWWLRNLALLSRRLRHVHFERLQEPRSLFTPST